jgi:ABC-type nitrate/sulfonate/bicarbonate transport system substrate-binding protein
MAPYVAEARGFLDGFGIKLDQTVMQTSTDIVRGLLGNSVDVAETSPPSLIVAYTKGDSDLALISGMVEKLAYALVAAKDVATYTDLRGKTIGISSFGDGLTVITRKLLAKGGLKEGDYSFVAVGSSGQRFAALQSGAAAAVVISQPYDFQLERDGYKRLGDTTEVVSDYSFIGLGARPSWVGRNTDSVTRMLAAFVQGQQYFVDPAHRAEALQDMQDYIKMSAQDAVDTYELLVNRLGAYPANLEPSVPGVQAVIDISVELGDVPPPGPSVPSVLALEPLHAAQRLAGSARG